MLTVETVKQYLTPIIIDVPVAQIPLNFPAETGDALVLRIDEVLFSLIQIDTARDMQLPLEEQLRWEINAKLSQPIEQYHIATTIYHQDEQTIQALGAAIEKTTVDSPPYFLSRAEKKYCGNHFSRQAICILYRKNSDI